MKQQIKDNLWGFFKVACVIVIVAVVILAICINVIDILDKWDKKTQISDARQAAYRARLPKAGDRVVLNNANVSVIKEYQFSYKFKVRYDDGTMADVATEEMLDLEKVKPKIPD